jgi:hypothetical protein
MSLISGLKHLLVIVVGRSGLGYSPGKKIAASGDAAILIGFRFQIRPEP